MNLPFVRDWLTRINSLPLRSEHHWPCIVHSVNVETSQDDFQLQCLRCAKSVPSNKKKSFLEARCASGPPLSMVVANRSKSISRGGLRIVSLNSGSIHGKTEMLSALGATVLGLQEVCVSPAQRQSVASAFRSAGASILFSHTRPCDLRPGRPITRLGVGVAIVCFQPWHCAPATHLFGNGSACSPVSHRLLSGVVAGNGHEMILHNIYMPVDPADPLRDQIWTTLMDRILQRPRASHVVLGDWQEAPKDSWYGSRLLEAGWLFHSPWMATSPLISQQSALNAVLMTSAYLLILLTWLPRVTLPSDLASVLMLPLAWISVCRWIHQFGGGSALRPHLRRT